MVGSEDCRASRASAPEPAICGPAPLGAGRPRRCAAHHQAKRLTRPAAHRITAMRRRRRASLRGGRVTWPEPQQQTAGRERPDPIDRWGRSAVMIPGRSTLTCQGSTGVSTAGAGRLELNIPPSRSRRSASHDVRPTGHHEAWDSSRRRLTGSPTSWTGTGAARSTAWVDAANSGRIGTRSRESNDRTVIYPLTRTATHTVWPEQRLKGDQCVGSHW
jgi:hypothetical protein